jgi:hypothetical protein
MPAPYTQLDQNQILQRSFDEAEDRLRVEAEVTAVLGTVECIITQESDSISIGDGTTLFTGTSDTPGQFSLDTHITNESLPVSFAALPSSNISTKIQYNEINSVSSGATENIITYTVPNSTTTVLQRISVSGENIAKYQVLYNSSVIQTKRSYFGGDLNLDFDFVGSSNNGFQMLAGDIIIVQVNNFRPMSGSFESTIQVVEIT